jgi:DNA-binding NtrC family response regulator
MSAPTVSVLVVDDDMAVCRIVNRMLSGEDYQIQLSQSVADALGAIEQKPFDVYILDYKLLDGNGLDVAERIRSKGSDAPIILISGYDPSLVGLRAEKLRILDIIEKPFSRATICSAVKKAIGFSASTEVSDTAPGVPGLMALAATERMRFPASVLIGAIIFLSLLACLAVYLFMHARLGV